MITTEQGRRDVKNLLPARTSRGLTLRQLAERTGLHPSVLSRIETGKREVTLREAVRLAQALHVSLEWIVTGKKMPGSALSEIAEELWDQGRLLKRLENGLVVFDVDQALAKTAVPKKAAFRKTKRPAQLKTKRKKTGGFNT